jgi:hypothetical protein
MPAPIKELELVERVWAEACDARWHSLKEIARRIRSPYWRVAMVVDFLEKYGFVRSYVKDERMVMINPGTPSPMEAANGLRSLLGA